MQIVFDASSLINLSNSACLSHVLNENVCSGLIGPIVKDECLNETRHIINDLANSGKLTLLSDEQIDTTYFLELVDQYELGKGETETICFAKTLSIRMCCDDRAARQSAKNEILPENITGSIGMLKRCISCGIISPHEAFKYYEIMIEKGGYLPPIEESYFSIG